MRVCRILALACLFGFFCDALVPAQENDRAPQLLLTPKLLHRLQLDRERQTVRWLNFDKRVRTVPDSPERGFELALYYAVTHDEQRGREAVDWGLAHVCDLRQRSLIKDWVGDLASPAQRKMPASVGCAYNGPIPTVAVGLRDALFEAVAKGTATPSQFESANKQLFDSLSRAQTVDPADLYATVEYIMGMRSLTRGYLRESDPHFFSLLPKEFLLSLRPEEIEHPAWMAHVAALALVTLDPNLENSQFLQGWAMEDSQMLHDGPGVAYEFLWADPYLPGIAYQNMDPWIYDPAGRLFARSSWDRDACWLSITSSGPRSENCPAERRSLSFGSLTLTAAASGCLEVAARKNNQTTIMWNFRPHAQITFERERKRMEAQPDSAGMWPVPNDSAGKVCTESQNKH